MSDSQSQQSVAGAVFGAFVELEGLAENCAILEGNCLNYIAQQPPEHKLATLQALSGQLRRVLEGKGSLSTIPPEFRGVTLGQWQQVVASFAAAGLTRAAGTHYEQLIAACQAMGQAQGG